jgi:class 3 adenylate cyclase
MFLLNAIWRMIKAMYHHFDTLPKAVELENSRFYTVSNVAETGAWMAHLVWAFVFYALAVYPLAWIQLISIAFYATAIIFNRHGKHMMSMTFALVELVVHQLIVVRLIGPGGGFQYFIPVVGIFPFLKPKGNLVWKWLLLLMCAAGFLFIELYLRKIPPVYLISPEALSAFNISNIVLSFGFVGIWGFYLTLSIYRSEVILRQRTTELAVAEQKAVQAEIEHALSMKERDNEIFRLKNVELKRSFDEILEKNREIEDEKTRSKNLLLNILPEATAEELLKDGKASTHRYESVTVLFTDFVGFTRLAEQMSAEALIRQIDHYFHAFDSIVKRHSIEKIKTIGDAYMAVGGLPQANSTHPTDVAAAALEMIRFVGEEKKTRALAFDIRIGIHSGPLVAGVVGQHKFQYDIWGDTVNVAARMEQNSEAGKINISEATYALIKDKFNCISRGMIEAKNKGMIGMYFLESISA